MNLSPTVTGFCVLFGFDSLTLSRVALVSNDNLPFLFSFFRNLHPTMDGDGDPHWSTGLSPQGPNEERKKGEHEKGSQDREGCVHPLRQGLI